MHHAVNTTTEPEATVTTVRDLLTNTAPDWLYTAALIVISGMAALITSFAT